MWKKRRPTQVFSINTAVVLCLSPVRDVLLGASTVVKVAEWNLIQTKITGVGTVNHGWVCF